MGEQTGNTSTDYTKTSAYAASSPRAARAYAAIMSIAAQAASSGSTAVFRGYAIAVDVYGGRGGWIYRTANTANGTLAQGWQQLATRIASGQYPSLAREMAKHYEANMPADEPEPVVPQQVDPDSLKMIVTPSGAAKIKKLVDDRASEQRKLDGYYTSPDQLRPMDIVQLAAGPVGVVERVKIGGEVWVRINVATTPETYAVVAVDTLRSVPPIAYERAGVPDAIADGRVPRDFALSELSMCGIRAAKRYAPGARLTRAAIVTDDRHEYGRAYVYAVASIIDAVRQLAERCPNGWHRTAAPRALQTCPECWSTPAEPEPRERREKVVSRAALDILVADAQRITKGITELSELVAAEIESKRERDPATDDDIDEIVERLVRRAQYLALRKVLDVLEGWREGAHGNHETGMHGVGDEPCWETFRSADIRVMVADAASELRTADPNAGHAIPDLSAPS